MLRRQLIPFLVTLFAAYFCGGSAARLHLLAVLFTKPVVALAIAALLLFVVQRSSDACRLLLPGRSFCIASTLVRALLRRPSRLHLLYRIELQLDTPQSPCLQPRFQRPPPAFVR